MCAAHSLNLRTVPDLRVGPKRVRPKSSCSCQAPWHDLDHGEAEQGGGGSGEVFEIAGQSLVAADPGLGSRDGEQLARHRSERQWRTRLATSMKPLAPRGGLTISTRQQPTLQTVCCWVFWRTNTSRILDAIPAARFSSLFTATRASYLAAGISREYIPRPKPYPLIGSMARRRRRCPGDIAGPPCRSRGSSGSSAARGSRC